LQCEFEDKAADRSETGRRMLERLQAMTIKVAMLIAAGWINTDEDKLEVTSADAEAAMKIITRWQCDGLRFAERVGENDFERKLQICLRLVQAKHRIARSVIAQNCHMDKRTLDMVQDTLVDRGAIQIVPTAVKGRPTLIEWELREDGKKRA